MWSHLKPTCSIIQCPMMTNPYAHTLKSRWIVFFNKIHKGLPPNPDLSKSDVTINVTTVYPVPWQCSDQQTNDNDDSKNSLDDTITSYLSTNTFQLPTTLATTSTPSILGPVVSPATPMEVLATTTLDTSTPAIPRLHQPPEHCNLRDYILTACNNALLTLQTTVSNPLATSGLLASLPSGGAFVAGHQQAPRELDQLCGPDGCQHTATISATVPRPTLSTPPYPIQECRCQPYHSLPSAPTHCPYLLIPLNNLCLPMTFPLPPTPTNIQHTAGGPNS